MAENWLDPECARRWDADPIGHNPVRAEQLDILVSLLTDEYRDGTTILDVGIGSGAVEELIFQRIPHAQVVGVDGSPAMTELAHKRQLEFGDRCSIILHDLTDVATLPLPPARYRIAISVQTIHNLPDEHKQQVFAFIYGALEKDGLFLLLDRIAVDTPRLFFCYRSVWDRLNAIHGSHVGEGKTFDEHIRKVEENGDLPVSLETNLKWLRLAGFEPACLHLHANRALIAARKW